MDLPGGASSTFPSFSGQLDRDVTVILLLYKKTFNILTGLHPTSHSTILLNASSLIYRLFGSYFFFFPLFIFSFMFYFCILQQKMFYLPLYKGFHKFFYLACLIFKDFKLQLCCYCCNIRSVHSLYPTIEIFSRSNFNLKIFRKGYLTVNQKCFSQQTLPKTINYKLIIYKSASF